MLLSLLWTLLRLPSTSTPEPSTPANLLDSILLNFNVPGGLPGLSIASPSRSSPNYYYHWVRDGALNIDALINAFETSADPDLEKLVNSYIQSSAKLQAVPNLSGGVGEPKFLVDGSAFNGRWGRPQNDGPALRALAVCKWLRAADEDQIERLWPFLYTDLDYVARVWALPSFDLWEEVYGYHFFTSVCHYGAMKAGALIAWISGHDEEAERFTRISEQITNFINANYLPARSEPVQVKEHFPSQGRGGLDAASILAVLELESLAKWTEAIDGKPLAFSVNHPAVLGTVEALIKDMTLRYPINGNLPGGVGRYPEDVYNGYGTSEGNPWFITTAAVAEVLCRNGQRDRATAHLQFIVDHMGTTLSEQMDKSTGFMVGAQNLTWSYCAVLRAFDAYA